MRTIVAITMLSSFILLAGCKKYLSEEPKKQTSIQTVEQLEALVDNALEFVYLPSATAIYSTDDTEIPKSLYKNNPFAFHLENLQYYVNSVDGVANLAMDPLWNGEYKKIFTTNLILENIDQVVGDENVRARVKADAHFFRAYSYWVLANHYCAPYSDGNLSTMGLPLKKTVDYSESVKRSTLKETYDFILADIIEAQKVANNDVDLRRMWRVSKKAIAAFLSRYYLLIGNYEQSLEQAELALASTNVKLIDYRTLKPGISETYPNPTATLEYVELNDWEPVRFLYWPEFYFTRYISSDYQWYIPSTALLNLYDVEHDLRYKHFMIPEGGRRFSVVTPSTFRYSVFTDGTYIPEGPTIAEVILNKAEVLARKGDVSGAMESVNILRVKRMNEYSPLVAENRDDAIKKVLEERRREMPFAMRWYDIRRFSVNDYAADDVVVLKDFYDLTVDAVDINSPKTYTLEAKRLSVPINGVEIDASKGQIQQNPY